MHRIAFGHPGIQLSAADIESRIFGKRLDTLRAERPIFITSLPRSGTTAMLQAFSSLTGIATHRYRDMPFVMAPVLWSLASGPFRKAGDPHERVHGDGIEIGIDSPEAFEEVLWRAFWPHKYGEKTIDLWSDNDVSPEAVKSLNDHLRKIIAVRYPDNPEGGRYLSKNNGNIARISILPRIFRDPSIIVLTRHPLAHAASLHRQHMNFLNIHSVDPFAIRYMRDIGHFEFGQLHRPFCFPLAEELLRGLLPTQSNYWLAYWIAAFDYVRRHRNVVRIVSYEHLCADGVPVMEELCRELGIQDLSGAARAGATFGCRTAPSHDLGDYDPDLFERAVALHEELLRESYPSGSRHAR